MDKETVEIVLGVLATDFLAADGSGFDKAFGDNELWEFYKQTGSDFNFLWKVMRRSEQERLVDYIVENHAEYARVIELMRL